MNLRLHIGFSQKVERFSERGVVNPPAIEMDRNTQEIAETLACAAGIYSSIRISLKCGLTKTPDYSSQISQIHESEALVVTVIFYTSGEKRPGPTNWFDWQGAHGTNTR